jgi:phosphohistidine phosphatase
MRLQIRIAQADCKEKVLRMNLYLLRHGEAEASAPTDAARQLTEKGRQDVKNVAKQFAARQLPLEHCFVSPYMRAVQTAELFFEQLKKSVPITTTELLVPEVRASAVIDFLDKNIRGRNILLVSHNPLLSELNALLTEGNIHDMHILTTSELVCLSLDIVGPGMGRTPFRLLPSIQRRFS